jgi:hypothetical protein
MSQDEAHYLVDNRPITMGPPDMVEAKQIKN